MTEKRHRTDENSGENAEKTAVRVARRCVRLRQGGEAALCVLDTGDAPERERDSLTSVGEGMVHELAEGELFRWAYIRGFDELRFTHPIALSAGQCMVHLRLTNARVGMEQLVFYTALGGGLARVDRLWRTFAGKEERSQSFDAAAAALMAAG